MRKLVSLLTFLLFFISARAQLQDFVTLYGQSHDWDRKWYSRIDGFHSDTGKMWSSGPLSEIDFRFVADAPEPSFGLFEIRKKRMRVPLNGVLYVYDDVEALMHQGSSYIREGSDIAKELKLNQGIFNITEKYALQYRDSLLSGNRHTTRAKASVSIRCSEEVDAWRSAFEADTAIAVPEMTRHPEIVFPDLSSELHYSFSTGYTAKFLFAPYASYSRALGTSFFSVEMNYKRHRVGFDINLSGDFADGFFYNERYVRFTGYNLQSIRYGYDFYSTPNFKIGAFVGGGVCGLVLERISTALLPWGMSGEYAVVSEGLSFEYVFAKIVDMDRRHRWLTSTSLFAKVYSDQILDEGIHPLSVSADAGLKISIDYKK